MRVVHDLLADVDRRAVRGQRELHGFDGTLHACAVTTRNGEQDFVGHGTIVPPQTQGEAGTWPPPPPGSGSGSFGEGDP